MTPVSQMLYLGVVLVLPVTALLARRLPIGRTIRMALAWAAIFLFAFLAVEAWRSMAGNSPAPSNSFGNFT